MTILHGKNSKHQTTTTRSNQLAPPRSAIAVLSIERGQVPGVLALLTVKIGSILCRGVRVMDFGRGTYVNFPSRKIDDEWVDLIEISSPSLRAAVVTVILAAVRELDGAQ